MDGSIEGIIVQLIAMRGLCFFVHVLKHTIVVVKKFIIITKTTTLSSIDGCNQNWMTLFTFHLHFQWKSY